MADASARNLRLGVVLQHRFREGATALSIMLRDGALGQVEAASCDVPWWRDQSYYDQPGRGTRARDGGGVLMTQAIHALDLFRSLCGGVRRVAARAATTGLHRMECEDVLAAAMELEGGGPASLFATTAAPAGRPETIRLMCTRATAVLTGGALRVEHADGSVQTAGEDGGSGSGAAAMAFSHEAHRRLLMDFAASIREGRDPIASGAEALRTQRLIAALLASADCSAWIEVER